MDRTLPGAKLIHLPVLSMLSVLTVNWSPTFEPEREMVHLIGLIFDKGVWWMN